MHGYLADKNSFVHQVKFFSKWYECHAIDLKGFGQNTGMDYPYSLDDYANEVIDYIKNNNLTDLAVIAHSFGARVAIKVLERGVNFNKLILTGSAGLKPRFNLKRCLKKKYFKLIKPFISEEKRLKFYSADYQSLDPVMRASFIKIVNEDLTPLVKKVKVDTLIIFGKQDSETPVYMAKRFHKYIKDSKLTILDKAGHFAFIDRPSLFNQTVLSFLTENFT